MWKTHRPTNLWPIHKNYLTKYVRNLPDHSASQSKLRRKYFGPGEQVFHPVYVTLSGASAFRRASVDGPPRGTRKRQVGTEARCLRCRAPAGPPGPTCTGSARLCALLCGLQADWLQRLLSLRLCDSGTSAYTATSSASLSRSHPVFHQLPPHPQF